MIRIILADDNRISLEYFKSLIDYKKIGFEIVSTAVDGEEALNDFYNYKPEVIITDVQMPCMSGIELAKRVKQVEPETLIIFLSSYEEFEYVRSALNIGVYDYILKHETTREKLTEKLLEVRNKLNNQYKTSRYYYESNLAMLLKEDNDISKGEYLKIFNNHYHLCILEQKHILPFIKELLPFFIDKQQEFEIKKVSYQFCNQIIAIIKISPFRYIVLIRSEIIDIAKFVYDYKKKLEIEFNGKYSIIVVAENENITHCLQQYIKILPRISSLNFYIESVILYYQNNFNYASFQSTQTFIDVENCLKEKRYDQLIELVENNYNRILYYRDYSGFERLSKLLFTFLLQYHHTILNIQSNEFFIAYQKKSYFFWMDAISFMQWIMRKLKELIMILQQNKHYHYSLEVVNVLCFINQNYADANLSAELIAQNVRLNINYLNSVFKKETGDTVWKRLTKIRLQKATKMLLVKDSKISEVYEKVGFNSLSYFSTVFRKYYGYSPQEYKKKNEIY